MDNLNNKLSNEAQNQPSCLGDVMHRFYMQIAKDYNVHTDRIMLAITDNGKDFQAYITNEEETELKYMQDYTMPNGA
jgi:hypothetical protein